MNLKGKNVLVTGIASNRSISYAIAKIASIQMCKSYKDQYEFNTISLMPTNIYGPTEATVWVTIKDVTNTSDITIGKP